MLVSKIIMFKQLIFLPLFVLLYSIDLKSHQCIITKALSHLQVRWGLYFQSPNSQILFLHLHGLLPWCLASFLSCAAFSGLGWELPAERGRGREPLRLSAELLPNPCKVSTGGYGNLTWICHLSPGCFHPWQSPCSSSNSGPEPWVQALSIWNRIVKGLENYGLVLT